MRLAKGTTTHFSTKVEPWMTPFLVRGVAGARDADSLLDSPEPSSEEHARYGEPLNEGDLISGLGRDGAVLEIDTRAGE